MEDQSLHVGSFLAQVKTQKDEYNSGKDKQLLVAGIRAGNVQSVHYRVQRRPWKRGRLLLRNSKINCGGYTIGNLDGMWMTFCVKHLIT